MKRGTDIITVVTGDIVSSSGYSRRARARVQRHLLKSWESVEAKFAKKLNSKLAFQVTAGDEFQFVCQDIETAFECMTLLRIRTRVLEIEPAIAFRASLAAGAYTISGSTNPYTQDGPAFHLARRGMTYLKKVRNRYTAVSHYSQKASTEDVNAILPVTDRIYIGWTPAQARAMLLAYEGLSGNEIAKRLHISPSAVSQRLERAFWEYYISAMRTLRDMLSRVK